MRWDLYCRVVDNYGDVGFGWRLATELAARGESVRLLLDDRDALEWMAPGGAPGVEVCRWHEGEASTEPPAVVLETFGCGLPDEVARSMARRPRAPVWIDIEYLSAEPYVERSHGLPSPQATGPAAGLTRWFFYPGFTSATGGLLREADLLERRERFSRHEWLRTLGLDEATLQRGDRIVSLFGYRNPMLDSLIDALSGRPTVLVVAAGRSGREVLDRLGPNMQRGALRAMVARRLTQPDYDRLLWSCDLNVVRGEDSFVRAQWAGVPFLWQAYPQHDGVHAGKVETFVDRHTASATPDLASAVRRLFAAWNGSAAWPLQWPDEIAWLALARQWRAHLLAQPDLCSRLIHFAEGKTLK
ncbi:MAG: elongation factor P maturation arginine rhamnosyltransferase EarP [Caldimonas sp.]